MPSIVPVRDISELKSLYSKIVSCSADALTHAIRAGELLDDAKKSVKKGDWADWVESSLPFSYKTAENYIRIFNNQDEIKKAAIFDLSKAYAAIAKPKKRKRLSASLPSQPMESVSSGSPANQQVTENEESEEPQPKPAKPVDEVGQPIPEALIPLWERREEAQIALTACSKLKSMVTEMEKVKSKGDLLYREVNLEAIITTLGNVYQHLACGKPYAVCALCRGLRPKTCDSCKGRGFVSRHLWEITVPIEVKAMLTRKKEARA